MEEKNVKIKIYEKDNTSPAGNTIDSTDIVFVPGKTNIGSEEPVLFTSVREFDVKVGNAEKDCSYTYAKELLYQGMPVVYRYVTGDLGPETFGVEIDDNTGKYKIIYGSIADKSVYSVKYITSGGYPVFESSISDKDLVKAMLACAALRGDAVALIDEDYTSVDSDADLTSLKEDVEAFITGDDVDHAEYGAMMTPWASYNTVGEYADEHVVLPASFAYLMCVAKAIKTSPNWLAMAGVSRGLVPNIIDLECGVVSNFTAENMQPKKGEDNNSVSINAITNIRPYGLTLWGNRTLMPVAEGGTAALNFLNIRNMLSDIKKLLYTTAKSCMFEQDTEDLWLKFKDGVRPLLDRLKAGSGISDYKIIRATTNSKGDRLQKGEVAAIIKIYPMYAVEYFELTVEINNEEVTVD